MNWVRRLRNIHTNFFSSPTQTVLQVSTVICNYFPIMCCQIWVDYRGRNRRAKFIDFRLRWREIRLFVQIDKIKLLLLQSSELLISSLEPVNWCPHRSIYSYFRINSSLWLHIINWRQTKIWVIKRLSRRNSEQRLLHWQYFCLVLHNLFHHLFGFLILFVGFETLWISKVISYLGLRYQVSDEVLVFYLKFLFRFDLLGLVLNLELSGQKVDLHFISI